MRKGGVAMTETDTKREIAKLKGRYTLIAALITTIGTIAVAVIQFYAVVVPLREQNAALEQKNTAQVEDNQNKDEEISDSQGIISDLELENKDLRKQYDTLQSDYNATVATIDSLKEQIAALETENTRLREQISTESVTPVPSNSTGADIPPDGADLLTACPPYETAFYDALDKISVMGIQYKKAFQLNSYRHYEYSQNGYAFFNLNQQYQSVEFDVGHVDGAGMEPKLLSIFLDVRRPYCGVDGRHRDNLYQGEFPPDTGIKK